MGETARHARSADARTARRGGLAARAARSGLWVSLVLALLLHLRQVAYLAELENRYKIHWQRADGLALILNVCLTALPIFALLALLGRARQPRLRDLRAPLLVWLLCAGVLSLASRWAVPEAWLRAGSGLGLALAAAAYLLAAEPTRRALTRAGVVFAPVALATFAQLLWWPAWGAEPEPLEVNGPPARAGATPVYVFVFDEWSYEQSVEDGRLRPLFAHLGAVASRSFVFHEATAPHWDTGLSLPHLLFAKRRSWRFEVDADGPTWRRGDREVRAREGESLFSPFARAGYRTALVGFYLPYRRLLGPDVQVVRTRPHVPRGTALLERMRVRGVAGARFLVGPAVHRLRESYRSRYSRHWFEINRETERDALALLDAWPDNSLLFAHWPTPHPPFVLEADGSYRGPYRGARNEGSAEDYARHLRNLDRIVGRVVDSLERSGRYDRSLLVFTSDHGWKRHDARPLRVPLVVKWPHQRTARAVDRPFPSIALGDLLTLALAGDADPESVARHLGSRSPGARAR